MASAASGPLVSFTVLLALPLCGAVMLPTNQFAIWTILGTITTVALTLDFGGVALTSARFGTVSTVRLLTQASGLSALGALLIGGTAALLWIPYSQTDAAVGMGFFEGLAAIGVSTLAAVFRGALAVLAQMALHLEESRLRILVTAGQAFLCFGIALTLLVVAPSAWALPLGWAGSSAIILLAALALMRRHGKFAPAPALVSSHGASTITFVWSRSLASVLGAVITQADRWIVGAIGGAELLATYEVAWRIASLPRFLVQNLAVSVSSEAGHLFRSTPGKIRKLLRTSTGVSVIVAIGSAMVVGVGYFALLPLIRVAYDEVTFWSLLTAFTLIGLTAPLSFISVAIGRPALDIPYLLFTTVAAALSAFLGFMLGSVHVYILGNSIGVAAGALWYWLYGSKAVLYDVRKQRVRVNFELDLQVK